MAKRADSVRQKKCINQKDHIQKESDRPSKVKLKSGRDDLINSHLTLVRKIAEIMVRRMNIDRDFLDDLISAGYCGLIEAAERYQPDRNTRFATYAVLRIRGAMIDAIRQNSLLSYKAHRYLKIMAAVNDLRELQSTGINAPVKPQDLKRMGLAKILDLTANGALAYRLSLEDVSQEVSNLHGREANGETHIEKKQDQDKLRQAIASLPNYEQKIIKGYYFRDETFQEIGQSIGGLSKSWVSRLHSNALARLREAINE